MLLNEGFVASNADPCLFVLNRESAILYLIGCADDMLMFKCSTLLNSIKDALIDWCHARELCEVKHFLNMSVHTDKASRVIWLSQPVYSRERVHRFGMADATPL